MNGITRLLLSGCEEGSYSFANNGSRDIKMNAITITFKATDDKNKLIREGSCVYDKL